MVGGGGGVQGEGEGVWWGDGGGGGRHGNWVKIPALCLLFVFVWV